MTISLNEGEEFLYLGVCLAGFLFGKIYVLQSSRPLPVLLAQAVKYSPPMFPGIYSGIFILYLQYHASKTDNVKANIIIFYALCLLYVLSVATVGIDIVNLLTTTTVSNEHLFFF